MNPTLRNALFTGVMLGLCVIPSFGHAQETPRERCDAIHGANTVESWRCLARATVDAGAAALDVVMGRYDAHTFAGPDYRPYITGTHASNRAAIESLRATASSSGELAAIRQAVQTYNASYRTTSLFVPQVSFAVFADKGTQLAGRLEAMEAALALRIQQLAAQGVNVSAFNTRLSTLGAAIDAHKNAITTQTSTLLALRPDMGDRDVADQNNATRDAARTQIRAAFTALRSTVVPGLKSLHADIKAAVPVEPPQDFGFFHVDTGRIDPRNPSTTTNYTIEVEDFSSMVHIGIMGPNPAVSIADRLQVLHDKELKAVVSVNRLLYTSQGAKPVLQPNYRKLVDTFVQNNQGYLTPEYIKAFYIADEPLWDGTGCVANAMPYADFVEGSRYLKEKIPNIPHYISESHNCIDLLQVPPTLDFVSVHNYGRRDPSTSPYYLGIVRTLLTKLASHQKAWLVLDATWRPRYRLEGLEEEDMGIVAKNFWKLACAPEFAGKFDSIFAYRWPGDDSGGVTPGARSFSPEVQQVYRDIFSRIQANSCAPL